MTKIKELVYMILDKVKLESDDADFTEDHIIFMLSKYRAFLLKQRYQDKKKPVTATNYQTIALSLAKSKKLNSLCDDGTYMKSVETVPTIMFLGIPKIYSLDYFDGIFNYINRDRMAFVGFNKYFLNMIYCTVSDNNRLYLKSKNPQFEHLERVNFTAVFEDPYLAYSLNSSTSASLIEEIFPIEEALVSPLIELVMKDLLNSVYKPSDNVNNASDDMDNMNSSNDRRR